MRDVCPRHGINPHVTFIIQFNLIPDHLAVWGYTDTNKNLIDFNPTLLARNKILEFDKLHASGATDRKESSIEKELDVFLVLRTVDEFSTSREHPSPVN